MTNYPFLIVGVIMFICGLMVGVEAPHIYDGTTAAMPQITLPDNQYPNECLNLNYVKGNGGEKSDYYFDTTTESCNESCHPTSACNDSLPCKRYHLDQCNCCGARGIHV